MMGRIAKKLRTAGGESLVEALAAIMVGTLAVALLASSVMTATRMNSAARERDRLFYEELSQAEAGAANGQGVQGTVTVAGEDGSSLTLPVVYSGGGSIWAYALAPDQEGAP